MPLVAIRNLTKHYVRGGQVIPVLSDIDLDVYAGDYFALMGLGLRQVHAAQPDRRHRQAEQRRDPGRGRGHRAPVRGRSRRVARRERRLHLPVLQPDAGALGIRQRRAAAAADEPFPPRAPRARRHRARSRGLSDRSDHYPNELSGGQQQRVAIARALITDPTIIVADEPTGDLDRTTADEILGLLDRLNVEIGKTIIMVTHDPKAAEKAHRLIHLEKGVLAD